MRYYDLAADGKVIGSYAVDQPGKTLSLLPPAPNEESKWDGKAWVPDQEKVDARLAIEAKAKAKEASKKKIATIEETVTKAADFSTLRAAVLELVKQIKILNED